MHRLLRWLFPVYLSPFRRCTECGAVRYKINMIEIPAIGRFCTEEEREEHYWRNV